MSMVYNTKEFDPFVNGNGLPIAFNIALRYNDFMNSFIYAKTRIECQGKTDIWCMQAVNEILENAKNHLIDKTLSDKMIDNTEIILRALNDELKQRGVISE